MFDAEKFEPETPTEYGKGSYSSFAGSSTAVDEDSMNGDMCKGPFIERNEVDNITNFFVRTANWFQRIWKDIRREVMHRIRTVRRKVNEWHRHYHYSRKVSRCEMGREQNKPVPVSEMVLNEVTSETVSSNESVPNSLIIPCEKILQATDNHSLFNDWVTGMAGVQSQNNCLIGYINMMIIVDTRNRNSCEMYRLFQSDFKEIKHANGSPLHNFCEISFVKQQTEMEFRTFLNGAELSPVLFYIWKQYYEVCMSIVRKYMETCDFYNDYVSDIGNDTEQRRSQLAHFVYDEVSFIWPKLSENEVLKFWTYVYKMIDALGKTTLKPTRDIFVKPPENN